MAAGDGGDGAGDLVLGLGERLKLMASRIDSKLSLHKEAVVEYTELQGVIRSLADDKDKLEQERHRTEELAAVRKQQLARKKQELDKKDKELVAVRQQLEQKSHEVDQKNEELKVLRAKLQEVEAQARNYEQQIIQVQHTREQKPDGLGFEKQAQKIVKELMHLGGPLGDLVVKKIGKLDEKPFQAACTKKLGPKKKAKTEASELHSTWEKLVSDPSSWKPFKTVVVDSDHRDEVIDDDNEKLKELKEKWGDEAYNSVVDTLMERKKYNIDGKFDYLLWNSKERRKATLEDCIDCLIVLKKKLNEK